MFFFVPLRIYVASEAPRRARLCRSGAFANASREYPGLHWHLRLIKIHSESLQVSAQLPDEISLVVPLNYADGSL